MYLAEDLRLHRTVALKIPPADVVARRDRMCRFNQEVTAVAALNHPSIAHIYEIGESEGTHFIALEFGGVKHCGEYIPRRQTNLTKTVAAPVACC